MASKQQRTVVASVASVEDKQAVEAMVEAVRTAIDASPICAAILRRDGQQVGSVIFSGDDYIFETPRMTTYPTRLWTVARRLVHEAFQPEHIVAVTEPQPE